MVKVSICQYELEFERELVERFEYMVFDSFSRSAERYLKIDFGESNFDKIFSEHSEQEIKDVVIEAAKQEIALYSGEL